jgi:hypothetical protein
VRLLHTRPLLCVLSHVLRSWQLLGGAPSSFAECHGVRLTATVSGLSPLNTLNTRRRVKPAGLGQQHFPTTAGGIARSSALLGHAGKGVGG